MSPKGFSSRQRVSEQTYIEADDSDDGGDDDDTDESSVMMGMTGEMEVGKKEKGGNEKKCINLHWNYLTLRISLFFGLLVVVII